MITRVGTYINVYNIDENDRAIHDVYILAAECEDITEAHVTAAEGLAIRYLNGELEEQEFRSKLDAVFLFGYELFIERREVNAEQSLG